MPTSSIHYLFPPDQISTLPTWRFILHFQAPSWPYGAQTKNALAALAGLDLTLVQFPHGLSSPLLNEEMETVGVEIEVSPESRALPNALAEYESDVWKIYASMVSYHFGDLYYEAPDWQD